MSLSNPNQPKLVVSLRQYPAQIFLHDLLAGITVGLVALPLAMAFVIASGVTPQAGHYTAVIAGFLISDLGGSRTQIGGPTGAFVVIVAGIIARFGVSGLAMVTLVAGVILIGMALTGLGAAVRFIPRTVVIGFTNGIAILIASTQIKDFFGLRVGAVPSEFLPRLRLLISPFATLSWASVGLGLGTLPSSSFFRDSRAAYPLPSSRSSSAPSSLPSSISTSKPSVLASAESPRSSAVRHPHPPP